MWGWVYGLVKALLEVFLKRADSRITTISHEATPPKIAAINESDWERWMREHPGSRIQQPGGLDIGGTEKHD